MFTLQKLRIWCLKKDTSYGQYFIGKAYNRASTQRDIHLSATKFVITQKHSIFRKFAQQKISDRTLQTLTATNNSSKKSIDVVWQDGSRSSFNYIWLRDHCRCPDCLHLVSFQRQVDTLEIPLDIEPNAFSIKQDKLLVTWPSSVKHDSVFPLSWLRDNKRLISDREPHRILWGSELGNILPTVTYEEVKSTDQGLLKWLNCIHTYGVGIVTGVPTGMEQNRALVEKISYIRESIFGNMWDFGVDVDMTDTAYSNLALKAHTDGCFLRDPPGLQMFHLVKFEGEGGKTVIVDGFKVAQELRNTYPEVYHFFLTTPIPFHYIDKDHYFYHKKPIFEHSENGELLRVSFNNDDRATVDLPSEQVPTFYKYLQILMGLLRKPENEYWYQMQPGNMIVYNNWRVLHGRTAFNGNRRIVGCYLNYDDFESRRITLQAKMHSDNK